MKGKKALLAGLKKKKKYAPPAEFSNSPFSIISRISAEVRTGTISKSIKSFQLSIQRWKSDSSSACISCQQIFKSTSIQLETYSSPSGIMRPFSRSRR